MTRIESTARLIALECGEREEDWQKHEVAAISSLRSVHLTMPEMEAEETPGWFEYGKKLLESREGRQEMLKIVATFRAERNQRQ